MAGTMDTLQTLQPPVGQSPRFRPFASSVHHVTKGRYITSNDPRGYIPVYEYPFNNQWIMMDIDDGYILWTGIWKALGNSKADIVKMIDSQPELAQVIRRVRGGYLKIQGTWMPFEIALRLARRVAWNIREDLIPLFGPTFPSTCLSPDQPGYGQVVASSGRRRARRHPPPPLMPMIPARTPHDNRSIQQVSLHQPALFAHPLSPRSRTSNTRPRNVLTLHATNTVIPRTLQPRYLCEERRLLLEVLYLWRFLLSPLHDGPRTTPSPVHPAERIQLPALQQPVKSDARSVYALPPISALEDLRGVDTQDSAAVLRRLQSDDDDSYSETDQLDERQWSSRRSLSAPAANKSSPVVLPMRRSLGQIPLPVHRVEHPKLRVSVPSDNSRDGNSTCEPSPISPATPHSAVLGKEQLVLVPLSVLKEKSRTAAPYSLPVAFHNDWLTDGVRPDNDSRISACRYSCRDDSSDGISAW
ncbi:Transcriptional repressor XBP1 [Mycena sanguinolenta]|uniref:Transcriptional repressor XBP1 n=1 Tax=Mycena sanguinolenta TaxID=230812 RepID=A0A8H7DLI9_9AGAR|nr:Transcriptional repressor XBP1 [Mycena sanguinolenta]